MKYILPALFFLLSASQLSAENPTGNWKASMETQKVFIENKGQWNRLNNLPDTKILFGTEYSNFQVLFTKTGLTYRLSESKFANKEDREEREHEIKEQAEEGKLMSHEEIEKEENHVDFKLDYVQMQWENANPNVQIIAEDAVSNYFNYGMGSKSIDHVTGYKKLIYKNLYTGIDV